MTETATLMPLSTFIPVFTAISDRDWVRFKELEVSFANAHGVETWADVFNWRIMPALEPEAKRWLLVQKCSQGIKSVKILD
ncbi:hypothetical protein NIES4072_74860 [Nostoc commune NIES-4072]|uniref:Uncharacterized protein n=1 Tax=Nostoc commune NIES-4072 TaxID=2005467 RepID=A0A2R5G7U8_NOSCO|nr:hypothetical protein [Nostoc commune]BBD71049.1 hypothetical protein NIES4070_74600 [Nostoc commune HK-02]GBG23774.1 hypothetical protein NIES4072_74860 [Nostoc commune NIES-4072]